MQLHNFILREKKTENKGEINSQIEQNQQHRMLTARKKLQLFKLLKI